MNIEYLLNKKVSELTADEILQIISDIGNKSVSEYYTQKQKEREAFLKKKIQEDKEKAAKQSEDPNTWPFNPFH